MTKSFYRLGFWSSVLSVLLDVAWLAIMPVILSAGDTRAQFSTHPVLFRTYWAVVVLLTLSQAPLFAALGFKAWQKSPAAAAVGAAFGLIYLPINVSNYFLNGAILPKIFLTPPEQLSATETALQTAVDMSNRLSLFGSLDMFGYGALGIGWIALSTAFFKSSRLWSAAAILMIISGALCILGAAGVFVDNSILSLGSIAGGVVSVFAYCVLAPAFRSEK